MLATNLEPQPEQPLDTNGFPYTFGVMPVIYHQMQPPESIEEAQLGIASLVTTIADIATQIEMMTNQQIDENGRMKPSTEFLEWKTSALHKKRICSQQILLLKSWIFHHRKEMNLRLTPDIAAITKKIEWLESQVKQNEASSIVRAKRIKQKYVKTINITSAREGFLIRFIHELMKRNQSLNISGMEDMVSELHVIERIVEKHPQWGSTWDKAEPEPDLDVEVE